MGIDHIEAVLLGMGLGFSIWILYRIAFHILFKMLSPFVAPDVIEIRHEVYRHPEVEGKQVEEQIIDAEIVEENDGRP